MHDPLAYIKGMADQARREAVPAVHTANRVAAAIQAASCRNEHMLPWMVAAAAAVAAGMSAQLFTIVRALSDPLAGLFQMSAALIP